MDYSKNYLQILTRCSTIFLLHIILHSSPSSSHAAHHSTLQTYIVQLHPDSPSRARYASAPRWHRSLLEEIDDSPSSRILYSYESAIEGFAARLSGPEAEALRRARDVVAVLPERRLDLHTTYSYRFLGLSPTKPGGAWAMSGFGRGSIIGVLDTGVWPESPSFDDRGMPPPPRRWRGVCQAGEGFNASTGCNRKLIGARYFSKGHRVASPTSSPEEIREYPSPRDSHGHGTHTASIAGGSPVSSAGVLGSGPGEARGMAPMAHVAVYKVCWFSGCYSSDILAAMDLAISDGVDVLSLSLGGFPVPLYEDTIAIGSFRAMERGISVICAAGNNGPVQSSVANEAPWIATVGASMLDRRFPAILRLGNGKFLYGESMYPGKGNALAEHELELVYVTGGDKGSEFCLRGSLPREIVRGKMVICDRGVNGRAEKGEIVSEAGGRAMVLANTEINLEEDSVDVHVIPATLIGSDEAYRLKSYINSTKNPKARIIFGGTVVGKSRAPSVAKFSSRGPSFTDPTILKPDMIAPGVNIIAAWPLNLGPSGLPEDSRRVSFTVMSGTSMACPHVSGLAALLHSAHPKWTPAAIKSALMTTADVTDRTGGPIMDGDRPAGLFAIGSGHVNPERAVNPGLVYDIRPEDHVTHLCSLGYSRSDVFGITHRNVSCRDILRKNKGFSLNYPSFSVIFKKGETRKMVRRRITNVGPSDSIYSIEVKAPEGVGVRVRPRRLVFKGKNQSLSYRVWFVAKNRTVTNEAARFGEGFLRWNERGGSFRVRSPISVTWLSRK